MHQSLARVFQVPVFLDLQVSEVTVPAAGEIPSVSPVLWPSWRPRAANSEKVG